MAESVTMHQSAGFPDRLRRAVQHRRISLRGFQRQIAATGLDGTSYPAINRLLRGETSPSLHFCEAVAELLDIRPAWLMLGQEPMDPDNDPLLSAVRMVFGRPDPAYRPE